MTDAPFHFTCCNTCYKYNGHRYPQLRQTQCGLRFPYEFLPRRGPGPSAETLTSKEEGQLYWKVGYPLCASDHQVFSFILDPGRQARGKRVA